MNNIPELIIFDCDGVLVDSELIAARVLAGYISANGRATTTEDCLNMFTGLSLKTVSEIITRDWNITLPDNFIDELRRLDRAAFEKELKPISGVADVIRAIKEVGIKVCVASSGSAEKINHSLGVTGLIDLFDGNLFSVADVARGKPAPDIFIHSAKMMAAKPTASIVIEDSPAGITAGKAAGATVYGFSGGGHAGGEDYKNKLLDAGADDIFSRMGDLLKLIKI